MGKEPQNPGWLAVFFKEAQYEKSFKESELKVSVANVPSSQRGTFLWPIYIGNEMKWTHADVLHSTNDLFSMSCLVTLP